MTKTLQRTLTWDVWWWLVAVVGMGVRWSVSRFTVGLSVERFAPTKASPMRTVGDFAAYHMRPLCLRHCLH